MRKSTSKIVAFCMASVLAFSNTVPAMAALTNLDYDDAEYDQFENVVMGKYKEAPALYELIPTESHIVRSFSLNEGSSSNATPSDSDQPDGDLGEDSTEVPEIGTDANALLARSARLTTIAKEADLEPYIADPILRSIVFDAVKDGAEGAAGSDIEEALGNFRGSIVAKGRGITEADGIQYLRKAEEIDLRKNEIKDWSVLEDRGKTWYGYENEDGEWMNVTWNLGGNPFEKIPYAFGGRLVIKQPGITSYTYEDVKEFAFLRGSSDTCEAIMDVSKCTVVENGRERPIRLVSVTAIPGTWSSPLMRIDRMIKDGVKDDTYVKLTDICRSGTQLIAVGMDEELRYQTADEYDTITPGAQSAKYYVKAKIALYDKITIKSHEYVGSVVLVKTSMDDKTKRVPGAKYALYDKSGKIGTYTTDAQGQITVMGLEPGPYYFQEEEAPAGYELNAEIIYFNIDDHETTISGGVSSVSLSDGSTVSAGEHEVFIAGPGSYGNSPDIKLTRKVEDASKVQVTVSYSSLGAAPGRKGDAVEKVFYNVKEAEKDINNMKNQNKITGSVLVDVKYINTASGAVEVSAQDKPNSGGTGETTELSGTKTWIDEKGYTGFHPDIIISLQQNGNAFSSLTLHDGQETFQFQDLPKFNGNGIEYKYTVSESFKDTNEAPKFRAKQDGNNFINTYNNVLTDYEGMKGWDDAGAEGLVHPSVTIVLYQNDKEFKTCEIRPEQDSYIFRDLPIYDINGERYVYTVKEEAVENYESKLLPNGHDFLNTYIPPDNPPVEPDDKTTTVEGEKIWIDDPGYTGDHPAIVIKLMRTGKDGTKEIDRKEFPGAPQDSDYSYKFEDLRKTANDGSKYTYFVKEEYVNAEDGKEFKTVYDGYNIINAHINAKMPISGTKTWDDGGRMLTHPDIVIELWQNGAKIDSTVLASGSASYSFPDQPVADENGEQYRYTVKEQTPARYRSTQVGAYSLLNTYVPSTSSGGGGGGGGNPPGGNNTPPPGGPGVTPPTDPGSSPPAPENPPLTPGEPEYPVYPKGETPDPEDPNSPPKITVIDEHGVPRAYIKVLDKKTGKYAYILDESVPLGLPKTGDSRSCVSMLVFAGSTAAVIMIQMGEKKKKKKA